MRTGPRKPNGAGVAMMARDPALAAKPDRFNPGPPDTVCYRSAADRRAGRNPIPSPGGLRRGRMGLAEHQRNLARVGARPLDLDEALALYRPDEVAAFFRIDIPRRDAVPGDLGL